MGRGKTVAENAGGDRVNVSVKRIFASLVTSLASLVAVAAPFSTMEERIPSSVAEATRKQIQRYLGTNDFKGVPLLDRSVDWNWFTNWPDQFTFKDKAYRLGLTDTSEGDYFIGIKSRGDVRPGRALLATYSESTNFPPPLSISASWRADGSLSQRTVAAGSKTVLGHQFYPTGRLYLFVRDDADTGDYTLDYFDGAGQLVGTDRWSGPKERLQWQGQMVDDKTFRQRVRELYNRDKLNAH